MQTTQSLYNFARNKYITFFAIVFEVLMLVTFILLADVFVEEVLHIPTMLATHVPLWYAVGALLGLQYLIAIFEVIASFREDRRGITIPIVFLPGGIVLRVAIMVTLEVIVIAFKLLAYFISVLLEFFFQIVRLDKIMGTAHFVDRIDRKLEPMEILVNRIYNLLYFHKIHANSSVFSSVFNGSLSFWCINH